MWLKYVYWINESLTNECTIIPSYRYLIIMQQGNKGWHKCSTKYIKDWTI